MPAFCLFPAARYLATSGQMCDSDGHQMGEYIDDYYVELDRVLGADIRRRR